ncbi:MAG: OFA family MFS transporter [Candidatus Omnitrophica bacterium]|nr:OFA family MFS transporter [Candidatus Omnitrophota bacterium]MBU1630281.1 OFA family MFS transporter [Candidatus Omnitrophota bacterium]MBU1889704.1 OFA family MFS transporter [Candidatus Omnitrophota bacterium]
MANMIEKETRYRWLVIISGLLIIMCLGVAYSWGVFLMPIANEFNWGRGETSLAVSILLLVFSVFMVIGGMCEKRYGPKVTATLGGVLMCSGWVLSYFTKSLLWLYITYGVLAGIGTGLGYLPSISTGIKWFPEKRGLVTGIVISGFGFGSAFLAPLAARFIEIYGWRITMLIYGIGFGTIIITAAQFLKTPPKNWRPCDRKSSENSDKHIFTRDFSPVEMLKTSEFKLIFLTYLLSMTAGMMIITHIVAFASDIGYTTIQSAFILTILAIANGLGRIMFGIISDKFGRIKILTMLFGFIGISMLLLYYINSILSLSVIVFMIGICFGGFLSVYPPTTADYFGTKNFGINYGLVFLGYGAGCFIGPWLGGTAQDITGNYLVSFTTAGILALVGGAIIYLFLKPPVIPIAIRSN